MCCLLCVFAYDSAVSLLPSAALGVAKISIMNGADVTNQTALYPGVTVKPGAVLGVFTYAETGRTFPRHSITQVNLRFVALSSPRNAPPAHCALALHRAQWCSAPASPTLCQPQQHPSQALPSYTRQQRPQPPPARVGTTAPSGLASQHPSHTATVTARPAAPPPQAAPWHLRQHQSERPLQQPVPCTSLLLRQRMSLSRRSRGWCQLGATSGSTCATSHSCAC